MTIEQHMMTNLILLDYISLSIWIITLETTIETYISFWASCAVNLNIEVVL